MRQIWIPRTGGPEVLEVREAADPTPAAGEVRIRVRAAGVNFADTMARVGLYPDAPKLPCVMGYEVAGVIDAGPPERIGERVVAATRFGGYSEAVCVPSAAALALPAKLSFAQGAAVPVNWLTAWHMLNTLAHVQPGERVLIHAAAGGVGTAALQLAKRAGAFCAGTASAAKHARLRELGLDQPIDSRGDWHAEVAKIAAAKKFDVVLDAIGGSSFQLSYQSLAPAGRLVMFGASTLVQGDRRSLPAVLKGVLGMRPFWPVKLLQDNKGVFGVNLGRLWNQQERFRAALAEMLSAMERGELTPIVDCEVPFAEAARAHARLAERGNFGKVLLVP